jgi:hypothetical protein
MNGEEAQAQTTLSGVNGAIARTRAAHLWSLFAQVKAKNAPAPAAQ